MEYPSCFFQSVLCYICVQNPDGEFLIFAVREHFRRLQQVSRVAGVWSMHHAARMCTTWSCWHAYQTALTASKPRNTVEILGSRFKIHISHWCTSNFNSRAWVRALHSVRHPLIRDVSPAVLYLELPYTNGQYFVTRTLGHLFYSLTMWQYFLKFFSSLSDLKAFCSLLNMSTILFFVHSF